MEIYSLPRQSVQTLEEIVIQLHATSIKTGGMSFLEFVKILLNDVFWYGKHQSIVDVGNDFQ